MADTKLTSSGFLTLRDEVKALKQGHAHHSKRLREHDSEIEALKKTAAREARHYRSIMDRQDQLNDLLRELIEEVRLNRG